MPESHTLATIHSVPPVDPVRMHGGEPVLERRREHPWESRVVLNPAAVHVPRGDELFALTRRWGLSPSQQQHLQDAGGACVMLYRAQGATDSAKAVAPSSLGLAVFTPELQPVFRRNEPVIQPEAPFHNLGVEDPRCTRVGDAYYLYYTGYARSQPEEEGRVRICLATTTDFVRWELHGPVEGDLNLVANKNPALLPERVDGRWVLLHRPMEGEGAMPIHWAEAERPEGPWRSRGILMQSHRYQEFRQSWIGAGGPPVALGDDRFLMIYHQGHYTHDGRREYDLAAALLDFRHTDPVQARIEPLMRPSGPLEQAGDVQLGVDNVLFTCANYRLGNRLIIPYAGADSRIFGASIDLHDLVRALEHRA